VPGRSKEGRCFGSVKRGKKKSQTNTTWGNGDHGRKTSQAQGKLDHPGKRPKPFEIREDPPGGKRVLGNLQRNGSPVSGAGSER